MQSLGETWLEVVLRDQGGERQRTLMGAGEEERTITAVQEEDAAFRAAAAAIPFDGEAEMKALRNIFDGESSAAARTACLALGHQEKMGVARRIWEPWRDDPTCGQAVQRVVTDLDAEHLRPTSIEQRLIAGVQPACLGLFTLMQNLKPLPPETD